MADIYPGSSMAKQAVTSMLDDFGFEPIMGTLEKAQVVGELFARLYYSWPQFHAIIDRTSITVPAGTISVNSNAVVSPTTYYIYLESTVGLYEVKVSTTSPVTNPTVEEYFLLNVVRMQNIIDGDGPSVQIFYCKYPAQDGAYRLLHNVREDVLFTNPIWLSGISISLGTTGKISTTEGVVRFQGNNPRDQPAITDGRLSIDNETTMVQLADITTYASGETITIGKYHKVLVGVLRAGAHTGVEVKYLVMRQSKPGTEYATAADAIADLFSVAAVSFPNTYLGAVTPIYYVVIHHGSSPLATTIIDIRNTGIVKGGGGSVASSHHALLDLTGYDDHTQYLKTDGTRQVSGNWNMGTVDMTTTGHFSGNHVISTATTGTIPVQVTSTTACTNLNADLLDGNHAAAFQPAGSYLTAGGTVALTADWDVGAYKITADTITSDVADGTAPFTSTSTTTCTNVNADQLDGLHGSGYAVAAKGVTNGDTHDHVGGDGAQIDHGGLGGLGDDDHTQYLLANGTRGLTGNLAVTAAVTIDGVDISAHAIDASAHHAPITLTTAADTVLGVTGQQISLDIQNASTVLAGPTLGSGPVAPAFRQLNIQDISRPSGTMTITVTAGQNDNVALAEGVRVYTIAGPTGNFSITGFSGGTDGAVLYLYNPTTRNMTISHLTGSSAGNQIITNTSANITSTQVSMYVFVYIAGTLNKWVLMSYLV